MKTNCRSSILLHKGGDHLLITVDRAEFLAAIKRAAAIAPPDSPLDVLKGVLLESDSARKMLTVTSTNLEIALVEKIPCSAQEDGALVYSARTLAEMLQRLPEDTVEISRKENRGRMTLTSGSVSYEVDVWDRGAFPKPDLPFPEDTVKVSGIPAVAQHTVFATAQDKDKPLLRCVNLMFTDAGLRAAGSNGMCIVTAKGDDQSTGDISLLVPALSLGKLAGMCKDEDEFRVGTTGKSIVFFKENFLFSARLMEGGYIDTNSLLKTITNSFTVLTDTKEMREALSSVLSVAPDGRVNLAFEDQKLVFRCSSDWGNASVGIDVIALTGAPTGSYWYILTKVLPYLGYQMVLSSHLDPALTPIKSPNFFRRDAYARTYACLSAYLPTIDIWNEYKNQNPETLEKPWNTLRKLYQDSNPDISDLTAAIPYTVFPSGLLCHHGRNISFCHDNYRDFFAAFHIANVVYGLCNGINLAALSPDAQEVFLLQLETLDNSILFDAISILRQYFGLSIYDISAQDTTDLSDTCAQIALPAILIRLLDAVIRRGELSKNEYSQLCQLRSTLCERFVLSFKALDESDPLQTKYCLFFSLALSMLARDYRTGVAGTRDLVKCVGYAQQCINGEKKLNIPKADGYLQVALCLNARMEDLLNVTDTKMNGTLPFSSQLADAVREAVRDYHEGSMYKRDEAVRTFRRNLFPRWKPSLGNVLACCDIFQIILEAAYEKYVSAANQNNQNYQEIARLGYVSKAYLVLAAIGTSGGALNLLAQMLINQANQYEADQRIPFFRSHPDIGAFVQQHAASYGWPLNDNYALAYRVLQSVCGIQRGSQPYSHMKKAELVLKGYVSESSSTQLTSLNIAINGGLAMGHYWKGRLLLEQAKQDHDRCNDYENAAIVSFCATNVIERFDHLPENTDEDAVPQLVPPQWLSAIELLRYPDRVDFRVDRRMVFQAIHQNLAQQVEEVQSDSIQIHNERYRLTKKDVRSNLERCLDMVKAQFPDKVPLIQEMIRSIK